METENTKKTKPETGSAKIPARRLVIHDQLKEKLENALQKIGWKLAHRGCDHFGLVDHRGKLSSFVYFAGRIELWGEAKENCSAAFNLNNCDIALLGGPKEDEVNPDCVSISPVGNDGSQALIQFYNHG